MSFLVQLNYIIDFMLAVIVSILFDYLNSCVNLIHSRFNLKFEQLVNS